MKRVLISVDQANLSAQLRQIGRKADFVSLQEFLTDPSEGRQCIDTYIYASISQHNYESVIRWHDWLRSQGFVVVGKRVKLLPDGSMKCNLDSELILDAVGICQDIHPDVFVLVSGDGDYSSLCHFLRRKGIRVEVASLESSIANDLKLSAHKIVDLSHWALLCPSIGQTIPATL